MTVLRATRSRPLSCVYPVIDNEVKTRILVGRLNKNSKVA